MTCIVALVENGVGYIGGERGASDSNTIFPLSRPKVWKEKDYLFGYFGSFAAERLKHNFDPPAPMEGEDLDSFMNTEFLDSLHSLYEDIHIPKQEDLGLVVITQGHIFLHNGEDMSMSMIDMPYFAEGSGMEFALGSMYSTQGQDYVPEDRIRLALSAACMFSTSCVGPFDVISSKD